MKTPISTAPHGVQRTALRLRYGRRSIPAAHLTYFDYCKSAHFIPEGYTPVYTPIAERLKATGDQEIYRLFCVAHEDELRDERTIEQRYRALTESGWINGPSYDEVVAKNQAAVEAERLGLEIQQRTQQILVEREAAARAEAAAQARTAAEHQAKIARYAREFMAEGAARGQVGQR